MSRSSGSSNLQSTSGVASVEFSIREVSNLLDGSKQAVDLVLGKKGYVFDKRSTQTGIYFYYNPKTNYTAKYLVNNGVVRLFVWSETRSNTRMLFYEVEQTKFKLDQPGGLAWTNPYNQQLLLFQ